LSGEQLDVEWLRGLVLRPQQRALAVELLGNRTLVAPSRVGLSWLLGLARHADPTLHKFAHRYLLEHFTPYDLGGVARLWALAGGDEPEPVRAFAAEYLKLHHPVLGPTLPDARQLGLKPALARDDYTAARVMPLVFDARPDVRRLGVALAAQELVRWNDRALLYRMAESAHRETRGAAAGILLSAGGPAEGVERAPVEWIEAAPVFQLAESPHKAMRELAVSLIRRHYDRIGNAERLGWLMESPDREVRIFAVRLLWERHRPRATPDAWKPGKGEPPPQQQRFSSVEALRGFLRAVLFGLPPGRIERRELQALPERALPASVAKRRLIETVRDLAVEDAAFAEVIAPVLREFATSHAKGEWQACVQALAQLRLG
jgi:hypothetical protein